MKEYQDLIGKIIIAAAIIIAAVIIASAIESAGVNIQKGLPMRAKCSGNIAIFLLRQSKGALRCALFICTCACYNKQLFKVCSHCFQQTATQQIYNRDSKR